jgi:cytoskeletal protein RodZ
MTSFGENLRRERELRGVSLREIADSTKISVRFLEALEQDRLDVLPGGIFRRAFVREYARHLGLDAERLVSEFVFAHRDTAGSEARPRTGGAAPNRGTLTAVAFALLLVPLLLGKVWRERQAAPAVAASAAPVAPIARVYATPAPAAATEVQAQPDGLALTLSAKDECWVAVRADGQTVLNRVLARGETETVQAQGEIVLSVGNAGGIEFRVDDRPGVPLGRSGEVRRNIVITRENLKTLVEDGPGAHTAAHSL